VSFPPRRSLVGHDESFLRTVGPGGDGLSVNRPK
jgi:hypothetical protein